MHASSAAPTSTLPARGIRGTAATRLRIGAATVAALLLGTLQAVVPTAAAAAQLPTTVHAAAYLGAAELSQTSLPATVSDGTTAYPVTWTFDADTFTVPYATVPVLGTADGQRVTAQVEVLPPAADPLVWFVDAGHGGDSQTMPYSTIATTSHAFDAVRGLATGLRNTAPDQHYVPGSTDWGYTYGGADNLKISTVGGDPNPSDAATLGSYGKDELGLRTNGTAITYRLPLDPGTYTLSSGFTEFYDGTRTRGIQPTLGYTVAGTATTRKLDPVTLTSTAAGTRTLSTTLLTVPQGATDVTLSYVQTSGEAPCISWFAVASGDAKKTIEDAVAAAAATVDVAVDANSIAASNVNGLTFKGFGVLSANSTSALLMDYKAQHPDRYAQLLQILFGGSHPIMNTVKIEMGDDRNTSTGPEPATMRTATEEADVAREPGFQLAADAKKYNPNLRVAILRWEAPAWASTNDKIYTWYKNTILAAYRQYGYMVDYVNPGVNESAADLTWTKQYADLVRTDTTGYVSTDPALAGFRPGEADLYHQIKVVISDEASLGTFGGAMVSDPTLRDAVSVAGYHYNTEDDAAKDFTALAEQYDKEVWNSEAQATFSNTSFRPNNNTADPTVAGTGIGGTGGPLEMANTAIKGFVDSRRTSFVYQPAIGSFYEGGQYSYKELLSARDPWSGWIHYDAGLAVLQQFSSFAVTGWENSTNTAGIWRAVPAASATGATGTNPVNGRNGTPSYLTLAAPDKSNFSTVVVNDSEYARTYKITPAHFTFGANQALHVWETRAADAGQAFDANYKRHVSDAAPDASGTYTVHVKPYSVVTVTSLDVTGDAGWTTPLPVEGQRTVLDADPANGVLWSDGFDYSGKTVPVIAAGGGLSGQTESFIGSRGGAAGATPLYTWDRNGAFEAVKTADGYVLRQQIDRGVTGVGGAWNGGDPITGIGDLRWTNYKAGVDVRFERAPAADNYAAIGARSTGGGSSNQLSGTPYALRLGSTGTWQLQRLGTSVASGTLTGFDATTWHHLALQVTGPQVTGFVDGQQVAAWTDPSPYLSGRVDLASGFWNTDFDNLTIEQVPGWTPYYGEYLDDLEMNTLTTPPTAKLVYGGSWSHADGQGMYVYGRSVSTNQAAGATLSYTFTGSGLDLVGSGSGGAKLDVRVDGQLVQVNAATSAAGAYQQLFALRGLPFGPHTVTLDVASGTVPVDAVGVVETRPSQPASAAPVAAALAAAEKVQRTADFTDAAWALLQTDIAQARAAVADPAGYGLDGEGAQQLVARLRAASFPIANQVRSLPTPWVATYAGQAPTLPATLTATMTDGTTRDLPITWDLSGVDASRPWASVTVPGSYGTATTTAHVEVVPRGLTYFADVNGTKTGSLGYDSPAYQAVAALVGGGLLNPTPDQVAENGATWGLMGQTATGTKNLSYKGIVPGPYSKLTTTGAYTANQVGATLSYTFTLPAGRHTVAAGTYTWWPSSSRSFDVFLDYDGTAHKVASALTLDTATTSRLLSYDLTLAQAGTVRLRLVATNAQSPLLSWAAVASGAYDVAYDLNGAAGSSPASRTGLLWGDAGLLPTDPTRTGFDLTGWNTAADGSGTAVTAATPYSALTGDTSVTSVTLYAQWAPNTVATIGHTPAGSPINDSTPTFSGTVQVGDTVVVTDGGTPVCTSPVTDGTWTCTPATALTDGSHTLTAVGTIGGAPATLPGTDTVVIDTVAPGLTVGAPAAGDWVQVPSPTVSGTSEPAAAINVTSGDASCTAVTADDGTWSCTLTLADGPHTLQVVATDAAGNASAPVSRTFVLDTVAPAAPVIWLPFLAQVRTGTPLRSVGRR